MTDKQTVQYPDREERDDKPHAEDVHGGKLKVTRKGDPETARAELHEELLRDEGVEVDPDGEYMIDETGQRVFVPYPTLGPRQTPRDETRGG